MKKSNAMTLAAVAVSLALTACKSTEGNRVEPKNHAVQAVENSKNVANPPKTEEQTPPKTEENPTPKQPAQEAEKEAEKTPPEKPSEPAKVPETPKTPSEPTKSPITEPEKTQPKAVTEDNAGKLWRILPLANGGSLSDGSEARRENRVHLVLPESQEEDSPFSADEETKEYNYYLTLDLGRNDKDNPTIKSLLKEDEAYLGQHSGTLEDHQLEGNQFITADSGVRTEEVKRINYLYVNQPYTSYGSLFTNENDSNLFNLRLTTGRDGKKQVEDGSGSNYAEYGVYDMVDGKAKWKEGLTGDATYKGNVIARVEKKVNGKAVAYKPAIDGDVTLKVHLDNEWHKSTLSGKINSNTLGTIELNEKNLPDARYLRQSISFNGETSVADHPHLSGEYSTELVGDNLNDAVGTIDIETEQHIENGITKYNAVFGGTKQ